MPSGGGPWPCPAAVPDVCHEMAATIQNTESWGRGGWRQRGGWPETNWGHRWAERIQLHREKGWERTGERGIKGQRERERERKGEL